MPRDATGYFLNEIAHNMSFVPSKKLPNPVFSRLLRVVARRDEIIRKHLDQYKVSRKKLNCLNNCLIIQLLCAANTVKCRNHRNWMKLSHSKNGKCDLLKGVLFQCYQLLLCYLCSHKTRKMRMSSQDPCIGASTNSTTQKMEWWVHRIGAGDLTKVQTFGYIQ